MWDPLQCPINDLIMGNLTNTSLPYFNMEAYYNYVADSGDVD